MHTVSFRQLFPTGKSYCEFNLAWNIVEAEITDIHINCYPPKTTDLPNIPSDPHPWFCTLLKIKFDECLQRCQLCENDAHQSLMPQS